MHKEEDKGISREIDQGISREIRFIKESQENKEEDKEDQNLEEPMVLIFDDLLEGELLMSQLFLVGLLHILKTGKLSDRKRIDCKVNGGDNAGSRPAFRIFPKLKT